ncbi:MAG: UDP-N-acetylmuramoyl-L-alanyl-D-glutamate--2,6-diaminopimelate ligase, partial [Deltaproteobacteria bacterium]|nr:UDP-N-acetylmuramoyl-L-alanyl-D-glutamate--2,6-diaminopimelate ligase [Deltaproteobacteria bacterium]
MGRVADSRLALSILASMCEGDPTREIILTGITGTDGKTSTAMLIEAGFAACGLSTGLVGTVIYRYAGITETAPLTTPDPVRLQGLFARMVKSGIKAGVMEVSSHALDQRRVDGCSIDCAVLTNLTRDHLDYHKTPEAYQAAKLRLF